MSKPTRHLLLFFVVTFVWTWACYLPIALTGNSPYQMPWMVLLILGGAGPSIVGVAMVLLTWDRDARWDYFRRLYSLRLISLPWWLVILLIFPAILAAAVAIDVTLGGSLPGMEQLKGLLANPTAWPLAILISFMSGPWAEEFGWRGFALDPLLKRFGSLTGSVVLGVIWGFWHLPLFFMPATWHGLIGFTGFLGFLVLSIGLALMMTVVYLGTRRSIFSAMLMHFTSNFSSQLAAPLSERTDLLRAGLILIVGLIMVLTYDRATQAKSLPLDERQPI